MSAGPTYTPEQEVFREGKVYLVDKPLNWTSFDVVNKVRGTLKYRLDMRKLKVGHAGTLDPLATGLLIVCCGKFTKRLDEFQAKEKEYTGTITLGATTPSYDLETEIDATYPTEHLTETLLLDALAQFTGDIEQVPPIYSAVSVDGKRAYKAARAGETIELKTRKVHIQSFELTRIELPEVDFKVVCSKGTYIRSLAYDFGKAVNSGGHLSALRRTRNGNFKVEDALTIEEIMEQIPNYREKESPKKDA